MSRYFLKEIKIEGFRGINNFNKPLKLKFRDDAVNSVFAPNALGKSSIFEALCFAIKGCISKLDELPNADRASDYYCNLFHSSKKSSIELTFSPDDSSQNVVISIERDLNGSKIVNSPTGHPDPSGFLADLNCELSFLDHKTFQKFIEDSPLKRGRSFSALLGSSQLSEYRQILSVLSDSRNINSDFQLNMLETQYDNAIRQEQSLRTRISQHYERITSKALQGVLDCENIIQEITQILNKEEMLKTFFEKKDIKSTDFQAIRAAIKKAEGSEKRQELSDVIISIGELERLESTSEEMQEQKQIKHYIKKRDEAFSKTIGSLFQKLYEIVKQILKSDEWKDQYLCPACNSRLQTSLLQTIEENLQQFENVKQAEKDLTKAFNSARWIIRLRDLENLSVFKDYKFEKVYSSLCERFNKKALIEIDLDNAAAQLSKLEKIRASTLEELNKKKEAIEKTLPNSLVTLTQQVEYAEQLKMAIEEFIDLPSVHEIQEKIKIIKRWKKFIEMASELFSKAESEYSQEKTQSIDALYRELFSKITNNPEIVPKLKKAEASEDLELRLENFYGIKDVAATTLLAESYRNAFAISIFLCAAIKDKPKAQFMVLDDITSSFDAGHQYALMEMLRNDIARPANPTGPQLIILSHDGLLEKYFDTLNGTSAWNHQRLLGLPPKGFVFTQAQEANHLKHEAEAFLNIGNTQQAEPLIRQYLEYKILEIIRNLKIPVPLDFSIRDDKKMVQNSLDAIKAALTLHIQANNLILDSTQISNFDKILVPALISNWVNHYATGSTTSLSPYVLKGVLSTIDKVSDCFKYDCTCYGTLKRLFYKNLSSKHCTC